MAVVIRLQGLPIVAGTMDIRHFFSGLTIPDGGVHIVGGDHGEAFIVFATDEDARLGMMRTGGAIKGAKVSLLLSSKTEMQNMIELSRRRFESGPPEAPPTGTRSTAAAPPTAAPSAPPRSAQFNAPATGAQFNTATAGAQFNTSTAAAQFATPAAAAQFAAPTAAAQFATPTAVAQFATPTAGAQFTTPTAATPFATPTAAAAFATPTAAQDTKAPPNMAPTFPNYSSAPSYSSAPTLTTALASLTPPLAMAALPPMPSLPPPAVPPVPPMSHLQHMALPPFNPALPPPLGGANPLLFNPLAPLPLGLPHMKAPPPDDLIVALQNLPYAACEPDVHDFFRGLSVQSVRFVRDAQGRKTGRALAKFFSPQDSYEALKRGGGSVGQRYVEVSPASERQWNSLEQKEAEPERGRSQSSSTAEQRGRSRSPQRQDLCVYLKGLPYEADKAQVKDFFKNLALDEDSLYIAYGANGKATGEGFVEFKTEVDYKSALAAHMQYMGARFIQVHPISRRGMADKIEQIRKRDTEAPDSAHRTPKTCLHITNIPYNVSRKDVRAFLEGLALFEESLNVLTDAHGNGLGQAVVQLTSEEEAKKAERLHRQKLNGRDAFVHLVTMEHMKEVERNPPPQNKRGQRQAPPPTHMAPPSHMAPPPAHFGPINDDFSFIRNPSPFAPPFSAPGNGLAPPPIPPLGPGLGMSELGMGELGVPPPLVPGMAAPVLDPPGFRPGGAGPPFGHDLRGAVPFERKTPTRSNGAPRPLGGTPPPAFPPDPALRGAPPPGAGAGANGGGPTVVKLQNMPFTVSADEIMDFLYGYAVAPGSVCLQFNDKGLPNGEAMVAFESAEEAAAAVHDLNERPIGNRKVKMSLG